MLTTAAPLPVSLTTTRPTTSPAARPIAVPAREIDPVSEALAADLTQIEQTERIERDRRQEADLARLRDLARFD